MFEFFLSSPLTWFYGQLFVCYCKFHTFLSKTTSVPLSCKLNVFISARSWSSAPWQNWRSTRFCCGCCPSRPPASSSPRRIHRWTLLTSSNGAAAWTGARRLELPGSSTRPVMGRRKGRGILISLFMCLTIQRLQDKNYNPMVLKGKTVLRWQIKGYSLKTFPWDILSLMTEIFTTI
jgi:hypothetical protein